VTRFALPARSENIPTIWRLPTRRTPAAQRRVSPGSGWNSLSVEHDAREMLAGSTDTRRYGSSAITFYRSED
jgi:hypothetical protein